MNPIPSRPRPSGIAGLVQKALALGLVGAGAGLIYNALSEAGIPLRTPARVSFPEMVSWSLYVEGLRATLQDAKRAFDRKDVLFVDARSLGDYEQGHIPGALNLPVDKFESEGRELLKDFPKDAGIITYCSGSSCQSSVKLAGMISERLGYKNTRAFFDGWHAWNGAGYPLVIGDAP